MLNMAASLLSSFAQAAEGGPAVHAALPVTVGAMLVLAFLYGLWHALDADHVTAISVFVSKAPRPAPAAWAAFRWGIGHSITVLALGAAAMVLGMILPDEFERYAEIGVGIVLIVLGVWVLKDLVKRRIHLHAHEHPQEDGEAARHLHLHAHESGETRPAHGHGHSPLLVGIMHGAAGSAGVLVMVPVAARSTPTTALAYLGVFSGAIILAMVTFGVLVSFVYESFLAKRQRLYEGARYLTGAVSLGIGLFWVTSHLY